MSVIDITEQLSKNSRDAQDRLSKWQGSEKEGRVEGCTM